MKLLLASLLGLSFLSACSKSEGTPDPGWYESPTNRLQLVVPSKYPTTLDSVAVIFRNPDKTKVLYRFQLLRFTGTDTIKIADADTRSLNPNETQQINYSTQPTGRFVYGRDAIYVRLTNYDTKEKYGTFKLTN